jgi:predicted nucleic acid-binding protein
MEQQRIGLFFDTSVVFSASTSSTGAAREIIRYALRRKIRAVISVFALDEAERNLSRKRPQVLPLFSLLRETIPFEIIEPTDEEVVEMQPFIAYKDAAILAAAKKAQVDYLVTLDRRHMIERRDEIEHQVGFKILLPGELLEILRQQIID